MLRVVTIAVLVAFCAAGAPNQCTNVFGNITSAAKTTPDEQVMLDHDVSGPAAITHWWVTGNDPGIAHLLIRFYIDGESTASIAIEAALASGIGFADQTSPWGTSLIGMGAMNGGYYNNIRVPFTSHIRVTVQQPQGTDTGPLFFIIRGCENIPIDIGGVQVDPRARLQVVVNQTQLDSLAKLDAVNLQGAGGVMFFWTLQVASGNDNFLEGCVRLYVDGGPKILLSSGTEDYFDSAWYFSAGQYHTEQSGLTHWEVNNTAASVSAYRFHILDPLVFTNSIRFVWRNGDTIDSGTGLKCINDNGYPVGKPKPSDVTSYAWLYIWPS